MGASLCALLFALGACEGDDYFGPGNGGGVSLGRDTIPPTVEIRRPVEDATVSIGDSVLVEVRLQDDRGVANAELTGVAQRGDPLLGTDTTVARFEPKSVSFANAPKDTVVMRFLVPGPDTVSENVSITVTARDSTGNSATASVQVRLVRGPRIALRNPTAGQVLTSGRRVPISVYTADEAKVTKIQINYGGVLQDSVVMAVTPDTVVARDTAVLLPAGVTGNLEVTLAAWNALGIETRMAQPLRFSVVAPQADQMGPSLSLEVSTPERMELTDSVRVKVRARDADGGSGISRLGITVLAINRRIDPVTQLVREDTVLLRPKAGTGYPSPEQREVEEEFTFAPFNLDPTILPDTLRFQVHAFAVDSAGNCAAAVSPAVQSLPCGSFGGDTVAADFIGQETLTFVVAGRTVKLPDGGTIADAVVDLPRQRLYLSNFSANKVDVLDLATLSFDPKGIRVGSQPWGLVMESSGDTLLVANSGGTNISYVSLAVNQEVPSRRLHTPNTVLYQLEEIQDANANTALKLSFFDFSDRPQFIAQDASGRLLYSTVPTGAAPSGTIRLVESDPDPLSATDKPEVYLLITNGALEAKPKSWVIANADSVAVNADGVTFTIWDHPPGYPNVSIVVDTLRTSHDVGSIMRSLGSDVIWAVDRAWNLEAIGLSDTTFVAASGDRRWVAFGEGATAPTGRVILWNAAQKTISSVVNVVDLVGNASERVLGLALNQNGSVGVARGAQTAYFFTNDLRQQGRFEKDLLGGVGGVTLHPGHNTAAGSDTTTLAFAGTGRHGIKIIDTFHFYERGEILIRDDVIGPLRASLPLAGDNAGLSCPTDDRCVIVKLYGVTSSGGVVVVNVRRRDLKP